MKRYVMEFIGTFFLTLSISLTGNPIAIGLMLVALVYVGGHISGGHFNPAVSFAVFLEKTLSRQGLLSYWAAQSAGATLALFFFMMITNNMFIPEMAPGTVVFTAMLIEMLFVMLLCWVCLVMPVEIDHKNKMLQGIQGIAIGLTMTAIVFIGGLFNPAVAVGSIVCMFIKAGIMTDFSSILVYIIGPLLGSLLASYLFNSYNKVEV